MICFPNAKINLGLHVVSRRPDGYHNIETIFYPVPLQDALEIVPAKTFSFHSHGITLDSAPEDNLVLKALHLLEAKYSIPPLEIHLKKAIPFGAGLGGGSSDAAFMLKLICNHFHIDLTINELESIASQIGADCAFFIRNQPVIASGIGNIFESIDLSLKGYTLILVKPKVSVSTKEAYSAIIPQKPQHTLKEIIKQPVNQWKKLLINDFETSVFPIHPVIKDIKNNLYAQGAVYAAMSGSGSALYGLFQNDIQLSFSDCFVWKGILE